MRRSRKRRWSDEHVPLNVESARGGQRIETRWGNEWHVRSVVGAKPYVCPGCAQVIPVGTRHVVAWVADSLFGTEAGLADRRHWHQGCWRKGLRP